MEWSSFLVALHLPLVASDRLHKGTQKGNLEDAPREQCYTIAFWVTVSGRSLLVRPKEKCLCECVFL